MKIQHQAYLWIGPEAELHRHTIAFLQKSFCSEAGCNSCHICKALFQKSYHAITWLVPENYYTLKQLDPLFHAISFVLDPGQMHIVIIERADLLTTACANSLLKSLEEPPEGYHFILLAPRTEGILPTILSRCVKQELPSMLSSAHRLLSYFTTIDISLAPELIKEIEKERIPEHEVAYILDGCMVYWHDELTRCIQQDDIDGMQKAILIRNIVEQAREKMPMPGSSKLFLKNLFLAITLAS
jgi:hypothetical protein